MNIYRYQVVRIKIIGAYKYTNNNNVITATQFITSLATIMGPILMAARAQIDPKII